MKVCFVAGTLERGGAERQLVFMLDALVKEGIQVKVFSLTTGEAFEQDIRDLGVEVEWIGTSRSRLLRSLKIITFIKRYRPDIIQSAHFYTNLYAAIAGRVLGIHSIGAIRNDLTSEIEADAIFGKYQFSLPHSLITNSEQARRRALQLDRKGRTIDIVRNAVEPPERKNNITEPKSSTTVIFVGRLVRQKRPDIFIKLADRLIKELPDLDIHFKIVGEGPLRGELEQIHADLNGSRQKIKFLGERSQMADIYREADILVSTSVHEGTPNVVLEAMANGLPVIATRVGGVAELIGNDRGLSVDPGDLDSLTQAVKSLVIDKELRESFARNARAHVFTNHSSECLRQRLPQVYRELLSSPKNR